MVLVVRSKQGNAQAAEPWSKLTENQVAAIVAGKTPVTIIANQLEQQGWALISVVPVAHLGSDQELWFRKDAD